MALAVPVLASLLPEPLAGVADTAFVKALGAAPAAGLAAATALLSSVFWIFNFLGIATQTEVARAVGRGAEAEARQTLGLALVLATGLGVGVALAGLLALDALAAFMSPDAGVQDATARYLGVRLLGGPPLLIVIAAFGALRGVQDMRSPLWIALVSSALNVVLDPLLIFGAGPVPALGVAGAAWATVASQWLAALWALAVLRRRIGLPGRVAWQEAGALLRVGRDLSARTGLLLLFLLLTTRAATRIDAEAGAAHQGIRQMWMLTAFFLDAYASAAQSLVAWFLGAGRAVQARRVAGIACAWGLATGIGLAGAMWLAEAQLAALLVPSSAHARFAAAWWIAVASQPANGLAFVSDGILWGASDYGFLRNAMLVATAAGLALLAARPGGFDGLEWIWIASAAWIAVRAAFGVARVWPGLGRSPLAAG